MRKELDGFLWRICNRATLDTLLGVSKGQYHIAVPKRDFEPFFRGLSKQNPTKRGGFEFVVPLQPFTGVSAVDQSSIVVRYLGAESTRKDWNFSSQRPDSAYELWRPNRGFISRQSVGEKDFLVIVRDTDNGFHARWIRSVDFDALPEKMRNLMIKSEAGWHTL